MNKLFAQYGLLAKTRTNRFRFFPLVNRVDMLENPKVIFTLELVYA